MHPVRMKLIKSGIVRASVAVDSPQTRRAVASQQAIESRRHELMAQKVAKATAILRAACARGM